MNNPEQSNQSQPQPTPRPTDYRSWTQGFNDGVNAAKIVEAKMWRNKMMFRTFAASVAGVWSIAMAFMIFGPSFPALLGGAAFTTFIFYVLDQTEELIMGAVSKLTNKKTQEKTDGNDVNQGPPAGD